MIVKVVNCFQISIFAVANTTNLISACRWYRLWIAFKLVSLQLQTQLDWEYCWHETVVNCFQISIFAVANTTCTSTNGSSYQLWIAFKLVSLQLQTQRVIGTPCSLAVVNCFQISIFAVANTTKPEKSFESLALWIAFKLVSLQLQTQPRSSARSARSCCELLSN